MTDQVKITMGLPVYNEEKHIAEAIESLLNQTYSNFTLLISDNASTNATGQICQSYAKKDSRITYVRQPKNIGSLLNFSYVVKQAQTPFFMWCSGNDRWDPFFVEKLLPAFKQDGVILSYPQVAAISAGGVVSEPDQDDHTTTHIGDPAARYLYFLWRWRARISNMFYGIWRTEALKKCSLDLLVVAPDMVILYEAALDGKFSMRKEVLFWMKRPGNIASRKERIVKQFSHLNGKEITGKENAFLITLSLVVAIIKIPFSKRYSLPILTRVWLSANAFVKTMLTFFVEPPLNILVKKILPQNGYTALTSVWKKIIH